MNLLLERYNYAETETEGRLYLSDDEYLYTLERPWIGGVPGGMPFESCVPDGEYELIPYNRSNGDNVFALRNPDRGVYLSQAEKGDSPGRYKILIHSANFVDEVVGCVAPGVSRTIHQNRRMVTSSRAAMTKIMGNSWDTLTIRPALGTN